MLLRLERMGHTTILVYRQHNLHTFLKGFHRCFVSSNQNHSMQTTNSSKHHTDVVSVQTASEEELKQNYERNNRLPQIIEKAYQRKSTHFSTNNFQALKDRCESYLIYLFRIISDVSQLQHVQMARERLHNLNVSRFRN